MAAQSTHAAKHASGALYDPSRALAGRSLRSAARALTNLETRPAIGQLQRQLAANRRQATAATQLVGSYFDQFGQHAQQALAGQQGIADQTNAALSTIARETQQQLADTGHTQQQQLQGLADRGLDGGAYARLAAALSQQQAATQNAAAYRSYGAQQGGNWAGLTASENATGALRGQESLRELGNAYAQASVEPAGKLADLRASRGDLMAKNVGALRDSERSYQTALATLGLNTQKAADQAAYQQGSLQVRRDALQATREAHADAQNLSHAQFLAKYGITPGRLQQLPHPAEWLKAHAPTYRRTGGELTTNEMNSAFSNIDAAKTEISQLLSQGAKLPEIEQALNNGYYLVKARTDDSGRYVPAHQLSVPRVKQRALVSAAMDLATNNGALTPASVRALRVAGLRNIRSHYRVAAHG